MTVPPTSVARSTASADLPLAVAPAMTIAFTLSIAAAFPIVPTILGISMTHILTLVAAKQQALTPPFLDALGTARRAAGAAPGEIRWLASDDCAGDLPFAHLTAERAHEIVRATLAD